MYERKILQIIPCDEPFCLRVLDYLHSGQNVVTKVLAWAVIEKVGVNSGLEIRPVVLPEWADNLPGPMLWDLPLPGFSNDWKVERWNPHKVFR